MRTRVASWADAARRIPPPVLLGWLVVAHVVLKLAVFPLVAGAAPFGDEQAYLNGGMALSNAVRDLASFTAPDTAELDRNVVASGWFMPGVSVMVAPLYVVVPDAGSALVRGYLGVVTLVLFVLVLRQIVRTLGHRWAIVVAIFPGLVPMWAFLSFGAWGDLPAGLVLVLLVLRLVDAFRLLRAGSAPSVRDGVALAGLAAAALYLRSATSVLLVGLGVLVVVAAATMARGAARRQALAVAALGGVLFVALLAPWSAYASHVLGGRVITTTTLPTVRAVTFGDVDRICFGECDPDSTPWFRPLRYAREVARSTGASEVEVLAEMSSYALEDVTAGRYLLQVDRNLAAYALQPTTFVAHIAPEPGEGLIGERGPIGTAGAWAVLGSTWLIYYPVLLLVVASLVRVVRRSVEARLIDVLVTVCLGGLLVQPFVHLGGGRYWTTAAPFFALGAASLLRDRRAAAGVPDRPGLLPGPPDVVGRWLGRIQVSLAAATAVVATVLLAAAAVAMVSWLLP